MNDLRLSAFAPRRRFSYAVSFDGYLSTILHPNNSFSLNSSNVIEFEAAPSNVIASKLFDNFIRMHACKCVL